VDAFVRVQSSGIDVDDLSERARGALRLACREKAECELTEVETAIGEVQAVHDQVVVVTGRTFFGLDRKSEYVPLK